MVYSDEDGRERPYYGYASRAEVKRRLVRGVYGSWVEWYQAAKLARYNGWTEEEIVSILHWYHPSTWVFALLGLVAVAGLVARLCGVE